ncbi:hypothetical protein ACJMK2_012477 [Sinanodonta woodiana]|uniref:Chitin-binding type-2 domain-containing protein n=1 Tax=Sinanodonta woodiana TaxID=1069815 RepID=A0ABD3V8B9_SINWO
MPCYCSTGTELGSDQTASDQTLGSTSTCKIGDSASHHGSCAKFMECTRVENGSLIMHERECQYPLLYDVVSGKCVNYQHVMCENRPEPKDQCKYFVKQFRQFTTI